MSRKQAASWMLCTSLFLLPLPTHADDSAAAIAAGGLVARRETRIVMAKEVLEISPTKVIVDYDFRNDTDQDVTTEVAFPIPPYQNDWVEQSLTSVSFSDFRVWVDGKPVRVSGEARAFLKSKEVTQTLREDKIDVATFGHFKESTVKIKNEPITKNRMPEVERLPKAEQKRLEALGLIELDDYESQGNWTVRLQYHWTQKFPAHTTVHIRHEYTPDQGFQLIELPAFSKAPLANAPKPAPLKAGRPQDDYDLLMSFCPDTSFLRKQVQAISKNKPEGGDYAESRWVDFILTSANTWRRPIEDFTLIVNKSAPDQNVEFCAPGPIEKTNAVQVRVHLKNFVPSSELHIGFF